MQRLGLRLPKPTSKKPVIWIHMVSVGETRAMIPVYSHLKTLYPNAAFYLSSTTNTGHEEAKRSLPSADAYFFLPLDFSWVTKKLAKTLQPDLFILSESDFWPNLLKSLKSVGTKTLLLNGKISLRSKNRFAKFPLLSKRVFGAIDHFLVQNQIQQSRFSSLNIPFEKLSITGNLKLSIPIYKLDTPEKQTLLTRYNLSSSRPIAIVASTHEGEEELILPHLSAYTTLLVPRHPQRFQKLKKAYANTLVIEEMGILTQLYQIAQFAIVGGSFIPGIGGHNIYEPIQAGIPVLFGPYMDSQQELVELVLSTHSGVQTSSDRIPQALSKLSTLKPTPISSNPLEILLKTKALEISSRALKS